MIYALVIVISILLRLYSIGRSSYWIDELISVHFATVNNWHSIFWDNAPFLYHLLLKGWIGLVGDNETFTRMLSAAFSLGATIFLMRIGKFLAGKKGAVVFGLLHAVMPLSVLYAQETRMYAMLEFFAAGNLYYFLKLESDKKAGWGYGITTALMALTHYLSFVPILAQCIYFLSKKKKRSRFHKWAVLSLGIGIAILLSSYLYVFSWAHLAWQILKFKVEGSSHWPWEVILYLFNRSWFVFGAWIVLVAATYLNWKKIKSLEHSGILWLSWSFIFGTLALSCLAGFVFQRAVFLPRYFQYLVPYVILGFGLLFLSIWDLKKRPTLILSLFLVLWGAGTIWGLKQSYMVVKAPWREIADYISNYPQSIVFTTRSEGIKAPYLNQNHVPVKVWKPSDEALKEMEALLKKGHHLWIVDTFWGALTYQNDLQEKLTKRGFKVEDKSMKTQYSDPVIMLHFTK